MSRACGLARTLKPMISAREAFASVMSDSVIAPTPEWRTLTLTSLFSSVIFCSAPAMASIEPCTSPLMMTGSMRAEPAWMSEIIWSSVLPLDFVRDDDEIVAGVGRAGQALHFGRLARKGFFDKLSAIVVQRAHAAPFGARDEDVAGAERAFL